MMAPLIASIMRSTTDAGRWLAETTARLPRSSTAKASKAQKKGVLIDAPGCDAGKKAMSGDPDLEYALIDGTIVQVHQKATGAKGGLKLRPSDGRAAG